MTTCKAYSQEFISRFVDNEVTADDHEAFTRHMAQCHSCAQKEAKFRQITQGFQQHVSTQATAINRQMSHTTMDRKPSMLKRFLSLFSGPSGRSQRFGIKLASLGAAALIIVVAVFPWTKETQPGPSAIVNSVDTYGSSVMIIETADTQHTIIWFSET